VGGDGGEGATVVGAMRSWKSSRATSALSPPAAARAARRWKPAGSLPGSSPLPLGFDFVLRALFILGAACASVASGLAFFFLRGGSLSALNLVLLGGLTSSSATPGTHASAASFAAALLRIWSNWPAHPARSTELSAKQVRSRAHLHLLWPWRGKGGRRRRRMGHLRPLHESPSRAGGASACAGSVAACPSPRSTRTSCLRCPRKVTLAREVTADESQSGEHFKSFCFERGEFDHNFIFFVRPKTLSDSFGLVSRAWGSHCPESASFTSLRA
jgi:hypothetical protein